MKLNYNQHAVGTGDELTEGIGTFVTWGERFEELSSQDYIFGSCGGPMDTLLKITLGTKQCRSKR